MTNFQAAGFLMASRTRADLLQAQSKLDSISSELRWQQRREEHEQEARNLLFKIKKQLLSIERALPNEAAALTLLQITYSFFILGERLTIESFSSLADKDYFDVTKTLLDKLRQNTEDILGPQKWGDIENYYLFELCEKHCRSLYFLLRAKELRELDEQQQGVIGQLFYSLTTDKAKPGIDAVARRFGQDDQLDRFREKVSSSVVACWIEEEKKGARAKLASTLDWLDFKSALQCLEHHKDQARLVEIIGRECGFNAHESFCTAVYAELRERMLPIPNDEKKVSVLSKPRQPSGSYTQFLKFQVDPKLLTNIQILSDGEDFGSCEAEDVWRLHLKNYHGGNYQYKTEDMPEWLPLHMYFNMILAENILVTYRGEQTGPLDAASVYKQGWRWRSRTHARYRTEEMSDWRPWKELEDKIKATL